MEILTVLFLIGLFIFFIVKGFIADENDEVPGNYHKVQGEYHKVPVAQTYIPSSKKYHLTKLKLI